MSRIDFHIHTDASDGSWSAEETIMAAKKAGINYIAISDHDSVSNVKLAEYIAKKEGINFIRATELCSKSFGREMHILGYDVDIDNIGLMSTIARTMQIRENRDLAIVRWAEENLDKGASVEEYKKYKLQEMEGLPIMNYVAKKDISHTVQEFNGIKAQVTLKEDEDFIPCEEIIKVIKEAGGVAILAHPSYYFPGKVMSKEMLDTYLEMGIDGIECYSTYNPLKEQNEYYYDYCKKT